MHGERQNKRRGRIMTDLIKQRALNQTPGNDYWKDGVFTEEGIIMYCNSCGPELQVNFAPGLGRFVAVYSSPDSGSKTSFSAEGDTIFEAVDELIKEIRRATQCLAGEVTYMEPSKLSGDQ